MCVITAQLQLFLSGLLNSLYPFQVSLLTHVASNYLNANLEATRMGSAHASIVPYQVCYVCG